MLMSEFIDRTGFTPTYEEYRKIEESYYSFDGDKDAFCKAFVKNCEAMKFCEARATEIKRLTSLLMENERQYKKDIADREQRINELTAELDHELEWKPSDSAGTNMTQERYEHLANCGQTMTDDEAVAFITDECGFAPEKIRILHEANTYEVNKHRRLRVAGTFERAPVYESSDWNYVRFDCAYFLYELVNGELRFYSC